MPENSSLHRYGPRGEPHTRDCREAEENRDHYNQDDDVYYAAKNKRFRMVERVWWKAGLNSEKISQFIEHPMTRMSTLQTPNYSEADRAAYFWAVHTIREHETTEWLDYDPYGRIEHLVHLFRPDKRCVTPLEVLDSLTSNVLRELVPFIEPDDSSLAGYEFSEPALTPDNSGDRLNILDKLRKLEYSSKITQKRLCIVVGIDRAYSEETMVSVKRLVRGLERLFVASGKADVLFFNTQPYRLSWALREPRRAVELGG